MGEPDDPGVPSPPRREFIKRCLLTAAGTCAWSSAALQLIVSQADAARMPAGWREAKYWEPMAGKQVRCTLCPCSPFGCGKACKNPSGVLDDGDTCVCHVRANRGGRLYVTNYGLAASLHQEPIEKNPLYHWRPGTPALSVSAPGCNLACKGCQNWQMSQFGPTDVTTTAVSPAEVVRQAVANDRRAIAYTYTEPVVFYEYLLDIADEARAKGLGNAVVTGGYINPAPLREMCRHVDAISISVKAFHDQDYLDYARGHYQVILDAIETAAKTDAWLEVVVLVIPTISDDMNDIRAFSRWLKGAVGTDVPLHFSRYWPSYKLKNLPETPIKTLERARETARGEGIRFVYIGNLPGHPGANTYCPKCGSTLIERVGFRVIRNELKNGRCRFCSTPLPGRWT
jgi:pyruvate formate lyase activating enzyme